MESSVFLISGPAGIGKTTVCDRLIKEFHPHLTRVVSATTRAPRKEEVEGVDYYFINKEKFNSLIYSNGFLEYEKIHGNYYGTLREKTLQELRNSKDVLFNIDVNGTTSLQKILRNCDFYKGKLISVFLYPSSIEELKNRLYNRGTDKEEDICIRLETAKVEITAMNLFDYQVKSWQRENDYQCVRRIYLEESKIYPRK